MRLSVDAKLKLIIDTGQIRITSTYFQVSSGKCQISTGFFATTTAIFRVVTGKIGIASGKCQLGTGCYAMTTGILIIVTGKFGIAWKYTSEFLYSFRILTVIKQSDQAYVNPDNLIIDRSLF